MSSPPGSASREPYPGSRKRKHRYECSESSRAGFAELKVDLRMTGEELFQALQQVQGVRHVAWRTWKAEQGNPSEGRYMQRNILICSSLGGPGRANKAMEF